MRTSRGGIALALVAMLLGILAVSQFRAQSVYSRSLDLETPSSLTTLIANLAERNNSLRAEIFDLRLRTEAASDAIAGGNGSLAESERQINQLRVFGVQGRVRGPGISVNISGQFDEKAMTDLVNELRNAGAEAVSINDRRISPRSWFASGGTGAILVDGSGVTGPWTLRAIGSTDVMYVAITRIGGIVAQFELIYPATRFSVTREVSLDLPAPRP